jgi:hypothetical protein
VLLVGFVHDRQIAVVAALELADLAFHRSGLGRGKRCTASGTGGNQAEHMQIGTWGIRFLQERDRGRPQQSSGGGRPIQDSAVGSDEEVGLGG